YRRIRPCARAAHLPVRGLRHGTLHVRAEVRLRMRLAGVLRARRRRGRRRGGRRLARGGRRRGAVRELRRPSRPRLSRRAAADRRALLHQLGGIETGGGVVEKKATFGAGCFWGVEAAFRQVDGVTGTRVGYAGGTLENPTYEDVCSHTT